MSTRIVPIDAFRGQIDIGIITIREDEFSAVLNQFQPKWLTFGEAHYNIAEIESKSGDSCLAALLRTPEQGQSQAQLVTSHLISELDPSCIVVVGIAGAKPESEFTLGDVVLATRLHDFSVSAALPGGVVETSNAGGPAHRLIQSAIANLPAVAGTLGDWNSEESIGRPQPMVDLAETNFIGDIDWKNKVRDALTRQFGSRCKRRPIVTAVAYAAGNVLMKDPAVLQDWLTHARDLKAVEMELPGIFAAARSVKGDRPVLAIRGISDIVGFKRNPEWTDYACRSAASFARAYLASDFLAIKAKPKTSLFKTGPLTPATPSAPVYKLMRTLRGKEMFTSAVFSKDGTSLVTGNADGSISVWDSRTGRKKIVLDEKTGRSSAVEFSPDGAILATTNNVNHDVHLWDASNWKRTRTLNGKAHGFRRIALPKPELHPVDKLFNDIAELRAAAEDKQSTRAHKSTINALAFSPNAQFLATASSDRTLKLWECGTGQEFLRIGDFPGSVESVGFSPDGKLLATGARYSMKVWAVDTWEELANVAGTAGSVSALAFSADGKTLVSLDPSQVGILLVWDVETLEVRDQFRASGGDITDVAFSTDSRTIAVSDWVGKIRLFDISTEQQTDTREETGLLEHEDAVFYVTFSRDNTLLATASRDCTVKIWRIA